MDLIGKTLGNYRIDRLLGEGAWARSIKPMIFPAPFHAYPFLKLSSDYQGDDRCALLYRNQR